MKRKYYDLLQNLPLFIPNAEIGNKFAALIDKYPFTPYLDNHDSFVKWMHFIHNKVNESLGKDEIYFLDSLDNYLSEYRKKPIIHIDNVQWKKHLILLVFILMSIFFIYKYI